MDDFEDRERDKKIKVFSPALTPGATPTLDQVKSLYIASGLSCDEIAKKTSIPKGQIQQIINKHKLPELRKAYIREGIDKIQNKQVTQAQELMDIELNFKKLRIIQLENQLKDYAAYFARHGDFYKRHPVSGEILKSTDGIPLQLSIPDISKEISRLKESVTLSEGMRRMLNHIEDILNSSAKPEITEPNPDEDVIDINLEEIFGKD